MAGTQHSDELDDLDAERPTEPFVAQVDGRPVAFRPATGPPWRELLAALDHWPLFMDLFGPDDPDDAARVERLPLWKMRALVRAWRLHHGLCATDKDHIRLVAWLGKREYRAAVERDLHEVHGLDLTEEWQSRRWRRLLNLVDGLRRTSHLQDAMTQDDELADALLERDKGDEDDGPRRRMVEFSVEAELLSTVADRIGELIMVTGAGRGIRARRVPPMPRPVTAMHRARDRYARRKHTFTVARVFGYVDAKGQPTGKQPQGGAPPTF